MTSSWGAAQRCSPAGVAATGSTCRCVAAELAKVLYFSGRQQHRDSLARQALDTARRVESRSVIAEALSASRIVLSGPAHTELRSAYADDIGGSDRRLRRSGAVGPGPAGSPR